MKIARERRNNRIGKWSTKQSTYNFLIPLLNHLFKSFIKPKKKDLETKHGILGPKMAFTRVTRANHQLGVLIQIDFSVSSLLSSVLCPNFGLYIPSYFLCRTFHLSGWVNCCLLIQKIGYILSLVFLDYSIC